MSYRIPPIVNQLAIPARGLLVWAALVVLMGAGVLAQRSRWYEPYDRGVKSVQAGRYSEAVRELERAIAADPRSGANRYVEGVFSVDYFPYFYLGLAYLNLGELEKARQAFAQSKGLSRPLVARQEEALRQLDARARTDPDGGGQPGAPGKGGAADDAPRQAQALVDEAGRLVEAGRFSDARGRIQQAQQLQPGVAGAGDVLDRVQRREQEYAQLKSQAERQALSGDETGLRTSLNRAKSAHPEQFGADRLDRLTAAVVPQPTTPLPAASDRPGRDADATATLQRGRQLQREGRYADAEAAYSAAVQADPSHAEAATALAASKRFTALAARIRSARRENGDARTIQALVAEARALDPARTNREGLSVLAATDAAAPGVPRPGGVPTPAASRDAPPPGLRDGLIALFRGDAAGAIALLEPVSRDPGLGADAATAHAFLGVAYASRALMARDAGDRDTLTARADDEFARALAAQRDVRLPPKLVSPRILERFEQVRSHAR